MLQTIKEEKHIFSQPITQLRLSRGDSPVQQHPLIPLAHEEQKN